MMGAKTVELATLAEITMGTSPPGSSYNYDGVGDPLLNGPTEFGPRHPDPVLFTTEARRYAEPGDLLFCVRGSTTGRMNWADRRYAIGRGVAAIRGQSDSETSYLRAAIEVALPGVLAGATGATMPNLNVDAIRRIPVPEGIDRERVGAVFSVIDDLIENNRRRVEVLEEMARAIYREWFVHFRYPGHEDVPLVDSPLGPIPDSWTLVPSSEVLEINPRVPLKRGTRCRQLVMADLNERTMNCQPSGWKDSPSGSKFMNGDTLFARITPCLENGKTGFVQALEDGEVACGSTEFVVLRGRLVGPSYTYLLARDADFRGHAIASMSGASGRQRVRNECFDSFLVPAPPEGVRERFEDVVAPLFHQSWSLHRWAAELASLRDHLLPKLVTGQIDVSSLDLDALVSEQAS